MPGLEGTGNVSALTLAGALFSAFAFAFGFVGVASTLALPAVALSVWAGAGISYQSSPAIPALLRKNGQREDSSWRDSFASAVEMGTGELLRTAAATSDAGIMRRLRIVGVIVLAPTGVENSIQTLSATPLNRPNRHRRRTSS